MILDSFRLDGRVALVTGGTQGLGQSSAIALAEAGADVVILGRSDPNETGNAIAQLGRRWTAINQDLASASVSDLQETVSQVVKDMGRLDILVNNAGIQRRTPAIDFSEADWDEVLQINLKSVFFLAQAAGRVMMQQGGGKIINIASLLSFQGGITIPAYSAAKHGVAGITQSLSNEWAKHHINVNAIAPGYMDTANTTALRNDPVRYQAILDRIPAGHWGKQDDIQGLVVYLASAASDYMHGVTIPLDGGWMGR
ncbi:MAG: 2-dehydro-3-deoxy-D-gluconate 5-dehydrogenase KduD [Anaerolineae bacterium]|nr:2-dehydro-3-deoxy-D-gluconate 5-dehydrogenase KduD [Anaerolineae bacterium]